MSFYVSKIKNNKIFDESLLSRKFCDKNGGFDFCSLFLKRKRIEKGLKLEDVASGICSISYLSRLENNQTQPSEENLKLLFERLDLNYENIKNERRNNIYEEILKNELVQKEDEVIEEISSLIASNSYTNIERDLFVLYGSIVQKNFEEARFILSKLELCLDMFSSEELLFYIYIFTRYLYETNQNKRAYSQIKVLNKLEINNSFIRAIIYDLSIDIVFAMGEYEQVIKFYYLLKENDNNFIFVKKMTNHKMQMLVADSKFNLDEKIEEFLKIKKTLDKTNFKTINDFNYYFSIIYFRNNMFNETMDILKNILDEPKALALYGYLVKILGDNAGKAIFLAKVKETRFSKYCYLYETFCEYISLSIRGESKIHLYAYLRQKVLSQHGLFYDHIIKEIAVREIIELGLTSSKYKETLKYIQEYHD